MEEETYYKQMHKITLKLDDILKLLDGEVLQEFLDIPCGCLKGNPIYYYMSLELDIQTLDKIKFIKTYLSTIQ